jgi:hypothetical protein
VRVVSLIVAVVFALSGARQAWACQAASADDGCCCDRVQKDDAAPDHGQDGARLERACCCEADTRDGASSPPVNYVPASRDDAGTMPAVVVTTRIVPPPALVQHVVEVAHTRGPPAETLLGLHTLLLI